MSFAICPKKRRLIEENEGLAPIKKRLKEAQVPYSKTDAIVKQVFEFLENNNIRASLALLSYIDTPVEHLYLKGQIYQSINNKAGMIECVNKIMKIDPAYFESLPPDQSFFLPLIPKQSFEQRLVALEAANDYDAALQLIDEELTRNPKNVYALYKKARICELLNQPSTAKTYYQEVQKLDPLFFPQVSNSQTNFELACAYLRKKEFDKALELFRTETSADGYYFQSICLLNLKNYDEAQQMLLKAKALYQESNSPLSLEFQTHSIAILYMKGGLLLGQKKYDETLAICEEALRIKPSSPSALYLKGKTYQNLKDYNKAIESFSKIKKNQYTDGLHLFKMGQCYFELQQYQTALQYYEKCQNICKNNKSLLPNGFSNSKKIALEKSTQITIRIPNRPTTGTISLPVSAVAVEKSLAELAFPAKHYISRYNDELKKAWNLIEKGDWKDAYDAFVDCKKANPKSLPVMWGLALSAHLIGKHKKSTLYCNKYLARYYNPQVEMIKVKNQEVQ